MPNSKGAAPERSLPLEAAPGADADKEQREGPTLKVFTFRKSLHRTSVLGLGFLELASLMRPGRSPNKLTVSKPFLGRDCVCLCARGGG